MVLAFVVETIVIAIDYNYEPTWTKVSVTAALIAMTGGVAIYLSPRVAWWHSLLLGLGGLLFISAVARATDTVPLLYLGLLLNLVGLIMAIAGGITILIQKQSASPTSGQLVAPIVGHTADGQPVYGQPVYGGVIRSQPTNVFAILALVFSFLGGVLAIIFGHIALSQINRTGENGRGLAIVGLVLGYAFTAIWLTGIIAAVASAS